MNSRIAALRRAGFGRTAGLLLLTALVLIVSLVWLLGTPHEPALADLPSASPEEFHEPLEPAHLDSPPPVTLDREEPVEIPAELAESEPFSLLANVDRIRELHGIVLQPDGQPCANAEVFVHRPWRQAFRWMTYAERSDRSKVASVRTNSEGFWRQRVRPGDWYEVEARSGDLISATATLRQAGERVILQLGPSGSIQGIVLTDAGASLPGGLLIEALESHGGGRFGNQCKQAVALDGRYRFDLLPAGEWLIRMESPWHKPTYETVQLGYGEVKTCDLQLEREAGLLGQVRDERTQLPIHGAEVSIMRNFNPCVRTDASGRFQFSGLLDFDEEGILLVRALGYGMQTVKHPRPPGYLVLVDLIRGRTVTGKILRADGKPAHGAHVALAGFFHDGAPQFDWREVPTRSDGRFTLRDVRRDMRHGLVAYLAGSGTLRRDLPYWPSEQEHVDVGILQLPPSSRIAGTVVSESGQPIAGAQVRVASAAKDRSALCPGEDGVAGGPDDSVRGITDDLGRFLFVDLGPGTHDVDAEAPGYARCKVVAITLEEGQSAEELRLTLKPGVQFDGTVLDPEGNPVEAAQVILTIGEATDPKYQDFCSGDGKFHLQDVPPGVYRLEVQPDSPFRSSLEPGPKLAPLVMLSVEVVMDAKPLVLRLQRSSTIQGVVTDQDGEAAAAVVRAISPDGTLLQETRSGADGRYELSLLEGQTVTLIAEFTAGGPQARFEAVPAGAVGIALRIPGRP